MAVRVVCPHCDAAFNVADELRGKKVRCRECEQPVPVAAARPKRADDDDEKREQRVQAKARKPAPAPARRRDDDEDDERPRRRKGRYDDEDEDDRRPTGKKKQSSKTPLLIAGIGGGVVILAGVIGLVIWLVNRDDKKTDSPAGGGQAQGPPAGMMGGKGGPPAGMMGGKGGPPGGMMGGGGPPGGMMGKDGPARNPRPGDVDPNLITQAIQLAKELDPEVRKKIEASTVYIHVKDKEKNPSLEGSGSGFFAFEPGIVLTNAHVVDMIEPGSEEPESIVVAVHSGTPEEKQLKAKVLGVDQSSDLAVLRVDPTGLPPPLPVKSSSGLGATQAIYVCGFPRGKQISNTVTIFQGQVASLDRDPKTGVLRRVVLTSEMQQGNSGGPVVNAQGEVVGVNVAKRLDSRINFAVPGDYVHVIVNGRIARIRTGQSSHSQGHIKVRLIAEVTNPLEHLDKIAVEVWTGDDTKEYAPPPSYQNPPKPRPGDSERQRFELDLRGEKATGEFTLPELPTGKVCYWQPILTHKDKGKETFVEWLGGEKYQPDVPVYRRQAKLMHKPGTAKRHVSVKVKEKFGVLVQKAVEAPITVEFEGELTEQPGPVDKQGKSTVRVFVDRLNTDFKVSDELMKDKKEKEKIDAETQRALDGAAHLDLNMLINKSGDVEKSIAIAKTAPQDIKAQVESLGDDILQWLQAVSVPLPNREMTYMETWKAKHPFAVLTPVMDMHFKDNTAMELTYTYLGMRSRNDRDEGLVEMNGKLRSREFGLSFGCKLEGRALVDLETGLVSRARANIMMHFDLPIGGMKLTAQGTMEVLIDRTLPQGSN